MELANSIIDTLIVYTEAMAFYWFIAALVMYIDKRVGDSLQTNEECATEDKKLNDEQPQLPPASEPEQKLLPPSKEQMTHEVTPFNSKEYTSYWTTFTCKQLRRYLQDMGYTRLTKLCKAELIDMAKGA